MNIKDNFGRMRGRIRMFERRGGGDWALVDEFENVITNTTREAVMDYLQSGSGIFISHFGVGSGTTLESVTDTGLEYQVPISSAANPHKVFDSTDHSDPFTVKHVCMLTSTEPVTQPVALSEIGLFSAISGGSIFAHATHSTYTKTNQVELKYEYSIMTE